MRPSLLAAPAALLLALVGACAATRAPRAEPVPDPASEAFSEARLWLRQGSAQARERALEAARRAVLAAPDWVAPRRLLDDLMGQDLLGVEALAAHRRALELDPDDAGALYLAGRLEMLEGARRFERAVQVAPELSWGHHGLAWLSGRRGDLGRALTHQREALRRARDTWERSWFSSMRASYHRAAGRPRRALEILLDRLEEEEVVEPDRILLSVQAALIELDLLHGPEARRGYERGLELLRGADLLPSEIQQLADRLQLLRPPDDPGALELQLALAARPGATRDFRRAVLLLAHRPTPLALALLTRGREAVGALPGGGMHLRAARFAAGQFQLGVEEWMEGLPGRVLDEQRLPRDPGLREVVGAARALGERVRAAQASAPTGAICGPELLDLGGALLDAGWFEEARAVASTLAEADLERALELERRALAGQDLLRGMARLMIRIDRGEDPSAALGSRRGAAGAARRARARGETAAPRIRDLRGLLAALDPLIARCSQVLDGEGELGRLSADVEASPLLSYGFLGALVHPGPRFSEADQREGLGRASDPVPGLAAAFDRLGRFGLFGKVLGGGGPDGTILRRVLVEERGGAHLGVEWSGTVAWCEGTDLDSRAGRRGARLSGAALHEGYWIDLEIIRQELAGWLALERRFGGEDDRPRLRRALQSRGLRLEGRRTADRRRARRGAGALLGAAERLRLAVLCDRLEERASGARAGELIPFDELVEMTAIHEEGHLCDRARFLPLSEHLGKVIRLALGSGLSSAAITERLEYRAQLVTLCEVSDPRVPLVEVMRSAEGGSGLTAHAGGYRRLMEDLLARLDDRIEREPEAWPEIDPEHRLIHQLHWLSPERLRELCLELARREGLVGD